MEEGGETYRRARHQLEEDFNSRPLRDAIGSGAYRGGQHTDFPGASLAAAVDGLDAESMQSTGGPIDEMLSSTVFSKN